MTSRALPRMLIPATAVQSQHLVLPNRDYSTLVDLYIILLLVFPRHRYLALGHVHLLWYYIL